MQHYEVELAMRNLAASMYIYKLYTQKCFQKIFQL